jgi:hypothetical protein
VPERPPIGDRTVNSVEAGAVIAIAVAGWPLYQLVTSGAMDVTTAVVRGAIVVAACGYGVSLIVRLASRFEAEAEAERQKQLHGLYTDMEGAVHDGRLAESDATSTSGRGSQADDDRGASAELPPRSS